VDYKGEFRSLTVPVRSVPNKLRQKLAGMPLALPLATAFPSAQISKAATLLLDMRSQWRQVDQSQSVTIFWSPNGLQNGYGFTFDFNRASESTGIQVSFTNYQLWWEANLGQPF
jgi:hypothetical protein